MSISVLFAIPVPRLSCPRIFSPQRPNMVMLGVDIIFVFNMKWAFIHPRVLVGKKGKNPFAGNGFL
jgi:hypothetical protein